MGNFLIIQTSFIYYKNNKTETVKNGAPGENRTPTPLRELDFESSASTSSATGALLFY